MGFRIPLFLWPQGEGRRLSKPASSFAHNMGGGGFEFSPFFGQKGEGGGFNLLSPFGHKGEEEGTPAFLVCRGKGKHLVLKPL